MDNSLTPAAQSQGGPPGDILKAALDLAARGVPVFPTIGKKPLPGSRGFLDATTDTAQIEHWFSETDYQLALRPADAGWLVVDVDKGADEAELRSLPETLTVRTPSGGRHLYFKGDTEFPNSKPWPHVDIRSGNGYVLVPPSKGYVVEHQIAPVEAPPHLIERLSKPVEHARATVEAEDLPVNIARAEAYLRHAEPAIEGNGGDQQTYEVACAVRDFGITEDLCFDLMQDWNERCDPPWSDDELTTKIKNAYKYGQNEVGSKAVLPVTETFAAQIAKIKAELPDWRRKDKSKFPIIWPDEYAGLPDLEFWDDAKLLPRSPDGAVAILFGDYGSHKTNLVLTLLLDAVLSKDAKVCYAAGEGAHGVGKQRIPAHCAARGIEPEVLRGKLAFVPAVPLLASGDDVEQFIESLRELQPKIIVLDTLATATAGEDENGSRMSAFLTANGSVGRIRDAYKALVIVIAHQGKDASKGVRGHSGILGNADAGIKVRADKDSGAIDVFVEKMRDGPDRFSVYFQVELGLNGVPVPHKITGAEYQALAGSVQTSDDAQLRFAHIHHVLKENRCVGFENGVTNDVLASILYPDGNDITLARETQRLKNARRSKAYKSLLAEGLPEGSRQLMWRWCLPKGE